MKKAAKLCKNRLEEFVVIKKACEMIEAFLAGNYDPLRFSYDLPDLLCDEYETMRAENEEATAIFNENFPEICDIYERGDDPGPLMKLVAAEYEKVKKAL